MSSILVAGAGHRNEPKYLRKSPTLWAPLIEGGRYIMHDHNVLWNKCFNEHALAMYKQHRLLHNAAQDLALAERTVKRRPRAAVERAPALSLLDGLIHVSQRHFEAEEEFMLKFKYPDVLEHLVEHSGIMFTLNEVRANGSASVAQCHILIDSVLRRHETLFDADYMKYFIALPTHRVGDLLADLKRNAA
jgi:hemerythrin